MKDFIEGNLKARREASNKINQKAFKMISNSIFGRTLMDPVKYSTVTDIVTSKSALRRRARDPLFQRLVRLTNDRVLVIRGKKNIRINQPNFIGYHILEASKVEMYIFFTTPFRKHAESKMYHTFMATQTQQRCVYLISRT